MNKESSMNLFSTVSCLFFWFSLFIPFNLLCQSINDSSTLTTQEKDKLNEYAKSLFEKGPSIVFNLSSYDLKQSFEDIPDAINYDESNLKNLLDTLHKDQSNPISFNRIAEYYAKTDRPVLAQSYYQKAYENLDIKFFDNDSAAYYSRSAVLKNQLGEPDALEDLKRSLAINPNDSLSIYVYPLILISSGEFFKAKEVISNALEAGSKNVSHPYLLLTSAAINEISENIISLENYKVDYKKTYRSKNFDEIIDYTLLDKYAAIHANNIEIVNARNMADIQGLIFKMIFIEPSDDNMINFDYTPYDLNKIESTISKLSITQTINEFSLFKCLGYLCFMQEEWGKSLDYFNKAIEVFPVGKKGSEFNSTDCYDAIINIYKQNSDTLNYRRAIRRKIDYEPERNNSVEDLMLLAFDYFQAGRITEADDICKEVMLLDSNNFDVLRLKSHLNFLNGSHQMSQFYLENAAKNIRNANDDYNLSMQYAIYSIIRGDIAGAKSIIGIIKERRGDNKCPLCDKLIEEYCKNSHK